MQGEGSNGSVVDGGVLVLGLEEEDVCNMKCMVDRGSEIGLSK
jgi:hypothetical protein